MNSKNGKSMRFRLTIRKKLLVVCSFLLIVPILALGLITYKVASDETNALIENGLKNNVKIAGEMMESLDHAVRSGSMTLEEAQESMRIALLGEKREDNTRPINDSFDLGENGYFFVLDEQGTLLAHPLLEGQNIWDKMTSDGVYYIQDMIGAAQAGGGFTYYRWPLPDNVDKEALKVSYAELFPTWGWIVSAGSYMQDYNGGQKTILRDMVLTLVVCLVVGFVVLTLFALHISNPVIRIAERAERIAKGDLTGADIRVKSKDEIGRLADSFNRLTAGLRELAGNQLLSAGSLASSSGKLSGTIEETVQAVHQTAESLSELAANNEVQAGNIQETSRAMEDVTIGIGRIAGSASATFEASSATLQEAEEGNQLSERSVEQMAFVSSTVGDLGAVIKKLGDRSQQIGEIAAAIRDISAQTNLLALNASIEAAHAGEHGKGFAVVAGEIRKLAERSNASAAEVAELIDTIVGDIAAAGSSMEKGEREVQAGTLAIRQSGESFRRILEATRSIVDQAEEASAAAEQMSASAQEISASLQQMESVSARSAGAAGNISAVSEEQLASLEEISSSARSLRDMSDNMRQLAGRFKLK